MNKTDRFIGVVGGLLIYETLFCLSTAFSWLCSGQTGQPDFRLSSPFAFGVAALMGIITYQFFRNPLRHAKWLGCVAILVAALKFFLFCFAGSSTKVELPLWGVLTMSIQVICSPLIIGILCIHLWKRRL
jgi:hypothetical protein